jgi:hypothetical protein
MVARAVADQGGIGCGGPFDLRFPIYDLRFGIVGDCRDALAMTRGIFDLRFAI